MQRLGAKELFAGVRRAMKSLPGQLDAGMGAGRDVGIAEQRQDGMVEGRGGQFGLAVRGQLPVGGQDRGDPRRLGPRIPMDALCSEIHGGGADLLLAQRRVTGELTPRVEAEAAALFDLDCARARHIDPPDHCRAGIEAGQRGQALQKAMLDAARPHLSFRRTAEGVLVAVPTLPRGPGPRRGAAGRPARLVLVPPAG